MARAGESIARGLQETLMPFLVQRFQEQRKSREKGARRDSMVQSLLSLYGDRGLSENVAEPYVDLALEGAPQPFASLNLTDPELAGRNRAMKELLAEVEDEHTRSIFQTGLKAKAISPEQVGQYLMTGEKERKQLDDFYKLSEKVKTAETLDENVLAYGKLLNEIMPKEQAAKFLAKTVPAMRIVMENEMVIEAGVAQITNGARIDELSAETLTTLMGPGKFSRDDLDWMVEHYSGVKNRKIVPQDVIKVGQSIYEAEAAALFDEFVAPVADVLAAWVKPTDQRSDREQKMLTPAREKFFERFHDKKTGGLSEGALFGVGRKNYEKMIKNIDALTKELNLRPREKELLDQVVMALWESGDAPEDVDWLGIEDARPDRIPLNVIRQAYENHYEEMTRNARISD